MLIAGLVKTSLVDYPGNIACVLFTPGCNYNCFYCHNRSLIDSAHTPLNRHTVHEFLAKRAGQLDGVVITGGEPTLQPDLPAFIDYVKSFGYKIKLDSNGSAPQVIRQLLDAGACDYYAVDFKAPPLRYREICGPAASPAAVLKTIQFLLQYNASFEVRTTVVPQFSEADLLTMAQTLLPVPCYRLNRYRKPEIFLLEDAEKVQAPPHSADQLLAMAEAMRIYQPNVIA